MKINKEDAYNGLSSVFVYALQIHVDTVLAFNFNNIFFYIHN
jgi:hypothetical protein